MLLPVPTISKSTTRKWRASTGVTRENLRKGDDFKLFGRTFQIDEIESGKVTVRDAETGAVRTFKPSLRVAVVEMGSESA